MISSSDARSSTPKDLPYPLHLLNQPQVLVWLTSEMVRRQMASALIQRPEYRGGVGIVSPTLWLFALVDPRGSIRELAPPLKRFELWQMSNRPEVEACPCACFIELESQGPWSESGKAGHHPLCQFDRTAKVVFERAEREAVLRMRQGGPAQERPDDWDRIRREVASG